MENFFFVRKPWALNQWAVQPFLTLKGKRTTFVQAKLQCDGRGLFSFINKSRFQLDLEHFLSTAYYFFKDVPAQGENYTTVTDSKLIPLKFCAHWWVENQEVMLCFKEMCTNFKKLFQGCGRQDSTNPGTKSFAFLKQFLKGPLAECKLSFTISVCKSIETFLVDYQTDAAMVLFLYRLCHKTSKKSCQTWCWIN